MICPLQTDENMGLLLDYSAGRLTPDKMAEFHRHMAVCPGCAALGVKQTAVWNALDAWEAGPVSLDFNRRLWQRIDAAPWYSQLRFANWKPALPLAGAVMMMAAGFMLDHPGSRPAVKPGPAAESVSIADANQVEQTLDDIQLLRQFDSAAARKQM